MSLSSKTNYTTLYNQASQIRSKSRTKKIVSTLTKTADLTFIIKHDKWYEKYRDFLNEKTINEFTQKETFTHYGLVAAYKSLRTNLPYLFTCKKYKNINIPKYYKFFG